MEKVKLVHLLEMGILCGVTAAVLFGVSKTRAAFPVDLTQDIATTAQPAQPAANAPEEFLTDSGSVSSSQDWIPAIEYDAYVPSEVDPQSFQDTVILGNSQAQALSNYGLLKNADFVTRVGLSINQVLSSKSGPAPIAKIYGKQYKKAVFIFGENELGWPYPQNFISQYKKVIEKVQELNPGIELYCQAIFPVSAAYSASSTNGITNTHVREFNLLLQKMCEDVGATFMPASAAFLDDTGALPDGVATDGVHFNYDYCKIWAGDLSAYLRSDTQDEFSTEQGVTVP